MPEFYIGFDVYGDDEKKKGEIWINHEKRTIEIYTSPVKQYAKKTLSYNEVFEKLLKE
jgi:hypothetical protein